MPEEAVITYAIPLDPVAADAPGQTRRTGSGVAHNGVRLDGPAPVDAILGAYTIAAFDDCGGHVNPAVGYHYHAVTDCLDGAGTLDATFGAPLGLAMDGHMIYPHLLADGTEPTGLDQCNGYEVDGTYVYHAGAPGSNAILGCLVAQAGCTLNDPEGTCDASATARRGPPPRD
ncbi:YHYH protein [uncultured Jannaschia sp.]|uniref:YHYH protein n=1 Tax=uncultured Jannaschia sp. TaxID=293347 RepID=UPI00262B10B6|nr:YHYH protein [uncultured Jannaschia sp.]